MAPKLDDYTKKVWSFLDNMKIDKRYSVSNLAKSENHEKFIQAIKDYMDTWPWQGGVTFNHDYSKLYKIHTPGPGMFQHKPADNSIHAQMPRWANKL